MTALEIDAFLMVVKTGSITAMYPMKSRFPGVLNLTYGMIIGLILLQNPG